MHKLTSPHNPQAKGLAESAVKNAKHLLIKCKQANQDFQTVLACWRNTPRADGYSPAQMFMGRRQQTNMPLTLELLQPINPEEIKNSAQRRDEDIPKAAEYERIKSKHLDGTKVLVKHHKTGLSGRCTVFVTRVIICNVSSCWCGFLITTIQKP